MATLNWPTSLLQSATKYQPSIDYGVICCDLLEYVVYLPFGNPWGRRWRQTGKVTKGSLELDLCFLSFFFLLLHVILHYICSLWFVIRVTISLSRRFKNDGLVALPSERISLLYGVHVLSSF